MNIPTYAALAKTMATALLALAAPTALAQTLTITPPDTQNVPATAGTTDFMVDTTGTVGDLTATTAVTWAEATADPAWVGRIDHTSVVFDDKMWVIGGSDKSEVWHSTDGVTWTEVTRVGTGWSGRSHHTSVVHDNKMWVIGGRTGSNSFLDDVWYSTDGATWTEVTRVGTGWSGLYSHTSVVYDNKMWVIGGGDSRTTDVWHSEDGATWTEVTRVGTGWSGRVNHTSVVYDNKIWVIGGLSGSRQNDVWHSTDGATWTQATASAPWPGRGSHASVVYDNKMWVIGGVRLNAAFFQINLNDVWHSTDGIAWTQATASAPWTARFSHASVVFDNKMWVIGSHGNDVWFYEEYWLAAGLVGSRLVVDYEANSGTAPRTGTITVSDGVLTATVTVTQAEADNIAPTFTSATFYDMDGNGDIDQIHINMSEDINSSTLEITDFTLDGGNITTSEVPDLNQSQIILGVTLPGTATATLAYMQGALADRAGNKAASNGSIMENDSAKPTITDLEIRDTAGDGLIDRVLVTWSEDIDTDDGMPPVAADFGTLLLPDAAGAVLTSAVISDPGGIANTVLISNITGQGVPNTAIGVTNVTVVADVWGDSSNNFNLGTTVNGSTDAAGPAVTIDQRASQADPTNGASVAFDVTFSEAVTGFIGADVDIAGSGALFGSVAEVNAVGGIMDGTTYTVTVTGMTGAGMVTASIPAGVVTDVAGNNNAASTSTDNTVAYDLMAPTVVIEQGASQMDPTTEASVVFTVTFSEAVTGFIASDVTLTNTGSGTLLPELTGSGASHTLTVTGMTGAGAVTASIPADVATDVVGNDNEASTSTDNTVAYDITAPTVTIEQGASQADPTNMASVVFDVTFSEAVTGFDNMDLDFSSSTVTGTLIGTVTGSGTTYTLTITGITGDGAVVASIFANAATDEAGNDNVASTSTDNTVVYDLTAPTVVINKGSGQADPTHVASVVFDVTFSEPVTGFDGSDVALTNTGSETLLPELTGSGASYTLTVTGMTGAGTVTASIPADVAMDAAGNNNTASTSTDNEVAYDLTAPTVVINKGSGQADPTHVASVVFDVTFSEAVTGFDGSDVALTNTGSETLLPELTGSGASYTLTVTGMTGAGAVTASIPADVAMDAAGNNNTASTSTDNTVAYDLTAPTVVIEQGTSQADPTHVASVVFDVTFSEPVTGFIGADVALTNTGSETLLPELTGSGASYTLTVTGMTGDGTVTASIPADVAMDAAGNNNTASTSTDNTVAYDLTAPTVVIEQGTSQADPTHVASVVFDVTFSEAVTGFIGADVDIAGSGALFGSVAEVAPNDGTTYTVTVTGMTGDGTVTASIPADVAMDAAGNNNTASTSTDNEVAYDLTAPTVVIEQGASQADPTHVASVVFDVTFSEPVTGFDGSDVALTNTGSETLLPELTGSGASYTLTVTGMTGIGVIEVSIPADVAMDAAGNNNTASTSTDNTVAYDLTAPTVVIEQGSGQADPTNEALVMFDVTFSEAVTGFAASDVDYVGSTQGTLSGTVAEVAPNDGTTYTVTVTGMTGDGTVTAIIPADVATDAAGNGNVASTSTDHTVAYDLTAPTVIIEQGSGQADPTNMASVVFDVTFSEAVAGFGDDLSDFNFSNSTVAGALSGTVTAVDPVDVGGTDYATMYLLTVTGMDGTGTVAASLSAGAAMDVAGNGTVVSTSTDHTVAYDVTPPTVVIARGHEQQATASGASVEFAVTFSEAVTDFDASDVDLTASTVAGTLSGTVTAVDPVDVGGGTYATTYLLRIIGMGGNGTVTANIPSGAATDVAGNSSEASTGTGHMVVYTDTTPPTVTIEQGSGQLDPTNDLTVTFDVTFSEPVTGFDGSDVVYAGSTMPDALSGTVAAVDPVDVGGRTYATTYLLTATTEMVRDGMIMARIEAGAGQDVAGIFSEASTSLDHTITYIKTTRDGPDPSVVWGGITAGRTTSFQITQDNLDPDIIVDVLIVTINGETVLEIEEPTLPYLFDYDGFMNSGDYTIQITMKAAGGREATEERTVQILGQMVGLGRSDPAEEAFVSYEESFEDNDLDGDYLGGWYVERASLDGKSDDLMSSWRHADIRIDNVPDTVSVDGHHAVVTTRAGTYQPREVSFFYSPSFDLSDFTRPAISFLRLVMFESYRDGVVFQASINDGRTWENLGLRSDINEFDFSGWHNSTGIISFPGLEAPGPLSTGVVSIDAGAGEGWTEDASEGADDDRWKEARSNIVEYAGEEFVRFRFALSSDGTEKTTVGFGVDNVNLFEQERNVLVEQFSSLLDPSHHSLQLDGILSTDADFSFFPDSNVVRINYFTDLANTRSEKDTLNQRNMDDPDGRIFLYGVDRVPSLSIGGIPLDDAVDPSDLKEARARLKHEELGRLFFKINLDVSVDAADPSLLIIDADFVSKVRFDDDRTELGLYVAILEPEVVFGTNTATNVLRKMLPDAAGQYERGAIAKEDVLRFHQKWPITHVYSDTLTIVAFIQDLNTQEVYQVAVDGVGKKEWSGDIALGVEGGPAYLTIYPNPGSAAVTVDFGVMAREEKEWMLFDPSGKRVRYGAVGRGEATLTIDTQELSSGLYIFRVIGQGRKTKATKQIIIRH